MWMPSIHSPLLLSVKLDMLLFSPYPCWYLHLMCRSDNLLSGHRYATSQSFPSFGATDVYGPLKFMNKEEKEIFKHIGELLLGSNHCMTLI